MKYIDADRLKAEIERLNSLVPYENNDRHNEGLHDAYKAVKNIIDSLQQEQPDGYNRAMIEVKAKVDKLYDEASIGLNEYDMGFYNGVIETCMKLRGFIKARTSNEQPQVADAGKMEPEVNLEEEIKQKRIDLISVFGPMNGEQSLAIKCFARHFYELGLNTRKWG